MRIKLKRFAVVILSFCLLFIYQNCSPSLYKSGANNPVDGSSDENNNGNSDVDDDPIPTTPPENENLSQQLGHRWLFIGDSQTRGLESSSYLDQLLSHAEAFRVLFLNYSGINATVSLTSSIRDSIQSCGTTAPTESSTTSSIQLHKCGNGGKSIPDHLIAYNSLSTSFKQTLSWIHFQDSGSHALDTIDTAYENALEFENFINVIYQNSPNVIMTVETAFNFGSIRAAQADRDWNKGNCLLDTSGVPLQSCDNYNLAIRAIINKHYALGRKIYLIDVNSRILAAEKYYCLSVGNSPENCSDDSKSAYVNERDLIWFQNGEVNSEGTSAGYHYRGDGNFIIGFEVFRYLGFNVNTITNSQLQSIFQWNLTKALSATQTPL